jgi:hypothetical protein
VGQWFAPIWPTLSRLTEGILRDPAFQAPNFYPPFPVSALGNGNPPPASAAVAPCMLGDDLLPHAHRRDLGF